MNCPTFLYHTSGIAVKASNPCSIPEEAFALQQTIRRSGGGGNGSEGIQITS